MVLESREMKLAGLAGREEGRGRGESGESGRRLRASILSRDTGDEPRRWARRERTGPIGGLPSLWVAPALLFKATALRVSGADLGSLQVGSAHTGLRGSGGLPLGCWRRCCLTLAALCTVGVDGGVCRGDATAVF